ncbi:MAG: hypothetical protein EA413_09795 [Cyanobium sp. PLM2.Bin73]|jgi:hypothetical protein|nr:MAG: hypothetical protein EA413_09795 [Cyanobium sp. PLM2.Bin73]
MSTTNVYKHGDIVAVANTHYCPAFVGRIDRIHHDTDPVWISLIDIDNGEWRGAQLQHVVGKLKRGDPICQDRLFADLSLPSHQPREDPPGVGVVFAR